MPTMHLYTLALGALIRVANPAAVDVVTERARLEETARGIASAAERADELASWIPGAGGGADRVLPLPFRGPHPRDLAVLALVAIAKHESELRAEVSDCRRTGDHGRSITLYQLHRGLAWGSYSRTELCSNQRVAAERALWVLSLHARPWHPMTAFRGFASGDRWRRTKAAREICATWANLAREHGLSVRCEDG